MRLLSSKRFVLGAISLIIIGVIVIGLITGIIFISGGLYAYPGSTRLSVDECFPLMGSFESSDITTGISGSYVSCYVSAAPIKEVYEWYDSLGGWRGRSDRPVWDGTIRDNIGPITLLTIRKAIVVLEPDSNRTGIMILIGFDLWIENP